MRIMDCTLRDGANVLGKGFDEEITTMILEGLIRSRIQVIEMGNCLGIGAYEADHSVAPLTDKEYLELVQPYLGRAEIGMFMGVKNSVESNVRLAADYGLAFLRIGANAGDGKQAVEGIRLVKRYGLKCMYSAMKAYLLSPEELAKEASILEAAGLDEFTIMDSAGTMLPDEVLIYTQTLKDKLSIPVAFHGHNNLGLSAANMLAAAEGGADILDCGLMGMARSAGNCATELAAALLYKKGLAGNLDFYALLRFIAEELEPAMERRGYHNPIHPLDLVYGYAGCHSSFERLFQQTAYDTGVDLYDLIIRVSDKNRKNPDRKLILDTAHEILAGEE